MDIPELVLGKMNDLTAALYLVFERATTEATTYLQIKNAELHGDGDYPLDPFVFSQLVRYYASELLGSQQFSGIGYKLERLPNNGIVLRYNGCTLRVWKADEGKLPAPGNSHSKQDFYQQVLFPDDVPGKLAVLWEVYGNGAVVLILACPQGDGEPWETGQSHWEITIPHPATTSKRLSRGDPVDDFEDLTLADEVGIGGQKNG